MRKLELVNYESKPIMRKLLNEYLLELSQYDPDIQFDKAGTPIYNWFDNYWTDYGRYPFFLIIDNNIAGIAMIRHHDDQTYDYSVAEFYVVPQFRGNNNAIWFVDNILNMLNGKITIETRLTNPVGLKFWEKYAKYHYQHNCCKFSTLRISPKILIQQDW